MFVSKGVIGRVIDVKNSNGVVMWTVMSTKTLFSHGKAAICKRLVLTHVVTMREVAVRERQIEPFIDKKYGNIDRPK